VEKVYSYFATCSLLCHSCVKDVCTHWTVNLSAFLETNETTDIVTCGFNTCIGQALVMGIHFVQCKETRAFIWRFYCWDLLPMADSVMAIVLCYLWKLMVTASSSSLRKLLCTWTHLTHVFKTLSGLQEPPLRKPFQSQADTNQCILRGHTPIPIHVLMKVKSSVSKNSLTEPDDLEIQIKWTQIRHSIHCERHLTCPVCYCQ
jgi:hypothetical protein